MAKPRNNPMANYNERQVKIAEDMADMARRSGYNMVAGDLDNLAETRRTVAGLPAKKKYGPPAPPASPPLIHPPVKRAQKAPLPGGEPR